MPPPAAEERIHSGDYGYIPQTKLFVPGERHYKPSRRKRASTQKHSRFAAYVYEISGISRYVDANLCLCAAARSMF